MGKWAVMTLQLVIPLHILNKSVSRRIRKALVRRCLLLVSICLPAPDIHAEPTYELRFYELDDRGGIWPGKPSSLFPIERQIIIGEPNCRFILIDTEAELEQLRNITHSDRHESPLPSRPPLIPDSARYIVDHWDTHDGLPASAIRDLLADSHGYLWIASTNGIARFDGHSFQRWNAENSPIIRDHHGICSALAQDSLGTVWFGMRGGLLYKTRASDQFEAVEGFGTRIECLHFDLDETLWIGTSEGILSYDGKAFTKVSGCNSAVHTILNRPDNDEVWYCSDEGIGRIDQVANAVVPMQEAAQHAFTPLQVHWDHSDRLWLPLYVESSFESGRLLFWEPTDNRFSPVTLPGDDDSVSMNTRVSRVLESRNGTIWAMGAWLWRKPAGQAEFRRLSFFEDVSIRTIFIDSHDQVWIGSDSQGLFRVRQRSVIPMATSYTKRMIPVWTLCEGPDQSVWMTTNAGVIHWRGNAISCYLKRASFGSPLRGIAVAANGEAISGFGNRGVIHLPPHPGHARLVTGTAPAERHTEIFEPHAITPVADSDGFWIGATGGLWKIVNNELTGPFLGDRGTSFEGRGVHMAPNGQLQIATTTGLMEWNPSDARSATITTPDPVLLFYRGGKDTYWTGPPLARIDSRSQKSLPFSHPLANANQLLSDHNDRYWIGANDGIHRIAKSDLHSALDGADTWRSVRFHKFHGMTQPGTQGGYQNSAIRTQDGKLWFATVEGVAIVDPDVIQDNSEPVVPILNSIRANGEILLSRDITPSNASKLDPFELGPTEVDIIEFELSAPCLWGESTIEYRLDGFDTHWNVGSDRMARYTSLSAGDYVLEIRATNPDGFLNSNQLHFPIHIRPAFYQTWWFRTVCALATVVILIAIELARRKFYRQKQKIAILATRTRLAQRLHTDLGSEITALSHAINRSTEGVEDSELPRRIRSLDSTYRGLIWRIHPEDDSLISTVEFLIDLAREYLLSGRISLRLTKLPKFPDRILSGDQREVVQLAFREVLQNILKHSTASTVELTIDVSDSVAQITLSDNGKGFDPKSKRLPGHHGVEDTQRLLSGIGGNVTFNSESGTGTTVCIRFPISKQTSG